MKKIISKKLTATLLLRLTAYLLHLPTFLVSLCILLVPAHLSAQEMATGSARVLVVYFSRTGNTEIMAREIADRYQADMLNIKANKYSDCFLGLIEANRDAWTEQRLGVIDPEIIDMKEYRLIFLGSPIWWYRPVVPLWTFVEKNDFEGKRVVLFNSFNSQFKDEYITEFKQLVTQKGGVFIDHISVRRGRIYNQIDKTELINQLQQLLVAREKSWH
jgi:flavodoxin